MGSKDSELNNSFELTQLSYSAVSSAVIATIINSMILTLVLWPVIESVILLSWLAAMIMSVLVRVLFSYLYINSATEKDNAQVWSRLILVGGILSALVWGSASILLFPEHDVARQVFLAFIVGGIAAGAITSLSYFRFSIYLFLLVSLLPLQAQFYFSSSNFGLEMGLMLSFYLIMLMHAAKRTNDNLTQNILLKNENKNYTKSLEDSEHRYEMLLESAADAFYLHDIDGKFVDVNNQGCVALGYSRKEILDLSVPDVEVGQSPEVLDDHWPKLENGEVIQLDGVHRRKDGTVFSVEVRVGLIHIENKTYFSIFARDITNRKIAELTIIKAKDEAEAANKAKSEFLSHMSHELRTPMTAILGFSQIMDSAEEMSEKYRKYSSEITKAGKHLIELINEILDLSSIEAGKLNCTLTSCNLNDIVKVCFSFLEGEAEKNNIQLIDEITSTSNYTIHADFFRFKQVMINLISNAVKYNKKNGTVKVSCSVYRENLRIKVSDTGDGLTEEEQLLLFKPFERIGEYKGIDGAGIGLVITKSLIEMMFGQIGVESEPGKGSVFWVQVPLST